MVTMGLSLKLLLKAAVVIACFTCFFIQVVDIWIDYSSHATNTALQYTASDKLMLPVLTFCSKVPSRAPLTDLREEQFASNSFALDDVFEMSTVAELRVQSNYTISEIRSMILGLCHTLRYLKPMEANGMIVLKLRSNASVHIYMHEELEEIWLMRSVLPYRFGYVMLDTKRETADGIVSVDLHINKAVYSVLQRDGHCRNYEQVNGFTKCFFDNVLNPLVSNWSCVSAITKPFVPESRRLPNCNSTEEANRQKGQIGPVVLGAVKSKRARCLPDCTTVSYNPYINYFHGFAAINEDDASKYGSGLTIYVYYDSLVVPHSSEVLLYNPGSVLSAIGGSLGLFLGFSCLSLAFDFLEFAARSWAARKWRKNNGKANENAK